MPVTEEFRASDSAGVRAAEPGFVWVYRYRYWDEAGQAHETSTRFATLDVIRCGLGAAIFETAKKIPVSQLIDGAFSD